MEDNELFGERHEQEENGLYGKRHAELCDLHNVTKRYLFWFESEGKDGWTFEIDAEDINDAYDKAYDTHGPQVAGMMYQVI